MDTLKMGKIIGAIAKLNQSKSGGKKIILPNSASIPVSEGEKVVGFLPNNLKAAFVEIEKEKGKLIEKNKQSSITEEEYKNFHILKTAFGSIVDSALGLNGTKFAICENWQVVVPS
ncbi:hypothetical protein KAJ61_00755 [Candidatus Parcubacteria bacterium]|nr:hypothetical protein [Candidatus Parcubacteria bacterium]